MADIPNLTDLGQANAVLNNKGDSPLTKLVVSLVQTVADDLKQALRDRNISTNTEGLSTSITLGKEPKITANSVEVELSMASYWKYINYGVNGTEVGHGAPNWGRAPKGELSFHQAILKWIPTRDIKIDKNFKSYDSLAWAIMTTIRKKGKAARPFLQDVVNEELVKVMKAPIEKLLGRAIVLSIKTIQ